MSKAEHESTTSRNLEQILIDRNGTLTAALVRIRALAAERRTDRDMAFLFQTAEDAIAQAGSPVRSTTIAASFKRWYELQTAKYPGDIPVADSEERHGLKKRIAGTRAVCLPDTLDKVRLLVETEKGYGREDEMLASIAADLEHLATGGAA
jgi:hypothetical protein